MAAITIRQAQASDAAQIHEVESRAFGQPDEAKIVDALRAADAITLELVAEREGQLVGHVCFSPVRIEGIDDAIGLAPLAVDPSVQRQGIGRALGERGLRLLRTRGIGALVVLGDPQYYGPHFGFVPAHTFGLRWEHDCPPEYFMALELRPGALATARGVVRYRPELGGTP